MAVDQVFIVAVPVGAAGDLDLFKIDGDLAAAVVQRQADLGHAQARLAVTAGEDDVGRFLGAQQAEALLAQAPTHGIHNVALAGAIGPDDRGHTGIEDKFGFLGECLEALNDNTFDQHRLISMQWVI